MFQELDKGTGLEGEQLMFPDSPKMIMFWEMQRAVVCKAQQKTFIRWHPK
jgi:hypothetical protein